MIEISKKYSKNIFLLCRGSTEDYFENIQGIKGTTDNILNFCNDTFDSWIIKSDNDDIKNELDYFFYCITCSK